MNEILATEINSTNKIHLSIDLSILDEVDLKKEKIYCFFTKDNKFEKINFSDVISLSLNNKKGDQYSTKTYSILNELFPNITKIGLTKTNHLEDYSFLYRFKKINSFNFYFEPKLDFDFTNFLALTEVSLYYQEKFQSIFSVKELRKLSITNYKTQSFDNFLALKKLEELVIKQSSIKDLEGIKELKNLHKLEISFNRSLTSIKPLENNTSIKELVLCNCSKLKDMTAIGSMKSLEILILENIKELDNLNFIKQLPLLKCFRLIGNTNIINGDLKWMTTLEHLTEFSIPIKKHYNIGIQDLKGQ